MGLDTLLGECIWPISLTFDVHYTEGASVYVICPGQLTCTSVCSVMEATIVLTFEIAANW